MTNHTFKDKFGDTLERGDIVMFGGTKFHKAAKYRTHCGLSFERDFVIVTHCNLGDEIGMCKNCWKEQQ